MKYHFLDVRRRKKQIGSFFQYLSGVVRRNVTQMRRKNHISSKETSTHAFKKCVLALTLISGIHFRGVGGQHFVRQRVLRIDGRLRQVLGSML
jgi:hypothetical protein